MDVELISVEADLLGTKTIDGQMAYLTEKCTQLGMAVTCQIKAVWNHAHLSELFQSVLERTSFAIVVCNTGIYTAEVKKFLIHNVWNEKGDHPVEETELKRHGADESGWMIKYQEKKIVVLPVLEMQTIFEKELYVLLQQEQKESVYYATLKLCGISETKVRDVLKGVQEKNPSVKTTVTSGFGDVCIRLQATSDEEQLAKKVLKPAVKSCMEKFKEDIYATDEAVSLEAAVLSLLKEKDLTLTTAESLTGGLLASKFTAVPGASEVFKQGFVTYCNRAKKKLLDVKKTTLKEYGAVSERTAKEMAKNGAFATGADVCVSLTGLAGPAAEEGKPVGLVYIACCYKNRTVVRECHFKGDRNQIREQSAMQALMLLRECILADQ